MSAPSRIPYLMPRASCEVRLRCGDVASGDRFASAEIAGDMTPDQAHMLFTKTLNAAMRCATDIHGGHIVSVCIHEDRRTA